MLNPPSFPFYVNNWLGSGRVTSMTPEQEGGYLRLLCYQWNSGDVQVIPADDDSLSMLSRLNSSWSKSASKIKACFHKVPGGLRNERLFECWRDAMDYREGQSKRAKERWKNKDKKKGMPRQKLGISPAMPRECSDTDTDIESYIDTDSETEKQYNTPQPPQGGDSVSGETPVNLSIVPGKQTPGEKKRKKSEFKSKWTSEKCPYFIGLAPKHFQESPEFVEYWTMFERKRGSVKKPIDADCAKVNMDVIKSLPLEYAIQSLKETVKASWQGLHTPKSYTQSQGMPNGDTLNTLQPREHTEVRYWIWYEAPYRRNGQKTVVLHNYESPQAMMDKLVSKMENSYAYIVGRSVYITKEADREDRKRFYTRQVREILRFIMDLPKPKTEKEEDNQSPDYVLDISGNYRNPWKIVDPFCEIIKTKLGDGGSQDCSYKAIMFGGKYWQEFLERMKKEHKIDLVTGKKIRR